MSGSSVQCARHGPQGFGIVCVHVARAVDSGERVGFFASPDPEMARPFAWCAACERYLEQHAGDLRELAKVADFKLLCARCWDEAKAVLDGERPA